MDIDKYKRAITKLDKVHFLKLKAMIDYCSKLKTSKVNDTLKELSELEFQLDDMRYSVYSQIIQNPQDEKMIIEKYSYKINQMNKKIINLKNFINEEY